MHVPPVSPHAAGASPATQVVPLQHPPLHVSPPVQFEEQTSSLHASFGPQSVSELHPQTPDPRQTGVEPEQLDEVQVQVPAPLHAGAVPEHDRQRPLVIPHAESEAVPVPAEHCPFPQHPPLHVPVQAVPHAPLTHASFAGHWLSALQPQVSFERQAGALPAQVAHVPPAEPHPVAAVPPTHVPDVAGGVIWQHPPAHGALAEHAVSQAWDELHVTSAGQSVFADRQPHAPPKPLASATHAVPTLAPAQFVHTPPLSPHAAGVRPAAQVPSVPPSASTQHPLLHACDVLHAVVHEFVVTSHACPVGQSVATLHPQVPELAMQAAPASRATQLAHIAPGAPHAVAVSGDAHVVPLQQVPLHGWADVQSVVHVCVAALHACPLGHEPAAPHPAPSVVRTSDAAPSSGKASGRTESESVPSFEGLPSTTAPSDAPPSASRTGSPIPKRVSHPTEAPAHTTSAATHHPLIRIPR